MAVLWMLIFSWVAMSEAMAYIDPGSGGYLLNTGLTFLLAGAAFFSGLGFWFLRRSPVSFFRRIFFNHAQSGAHVYDKDSVMPGYSLFDGRLIDVNGKVLHSWNSRYLGLILPDGKYVAQKHYESEIWGVYSWDGRVIWEKNLPIHHDIVLTPQGTLLTLTKEVHPYKGRDVDFCVIVEFDRQGHELYRWSTWDHLAELQQHHPPLELDRPKVAFLPETAKRKQKTPWGGHYDYYRINSIQVLPSTDLGKRDLRFQSGNWLISLRHGSMLFIIDPKTGKIVWKCIHQDVKDGLEGQHAAQLLPSGVILLFDNGRYRGWSRVLEIDPVSCDIVWEYRDRNFFTRSQGYAQRLTNGNTLITESERGRAFEITRDKRIVWEYYHPDMQTSSNSRHPESFGSRQWIYRMVRYPEEYLSRFIK